MRHVALSVLLLGCGEARFSSLPATQDRITAPQAGEAGAPTETVSATAGEGGEPSTVVQHGSGGSGSKSANRGSGGSPTVNRDNAGEAGAVGVYTSEGGAAGQSEPSGTGGSGPVAGSGGSSGSGGIAGQPSNIAGAGAGAVAGAPAAGSGGSGSTFCNIIPAAWDDCTEPAAPGIYSLTVPWNVRTWKVQGSTSQRYWAGTNAYYADVEQQNPCTDQPMFTKSCAAFLGEGTQSPTWNQSYILTVYVEVLEGQTIPCVTTTTDLQTFSCE